MNPTPRPAPASRRSFLKLGAAAIAGAAFAPLAGAPCSPRTTKPPATSTAA